MTCNHRLWTTHTVERCGRGMPSCLWEAHTVERRRAWNAIITFGQHKRRMTSGVACHHRRWTSLHSQTASGVACHHRLLAAHTANTVGHGMPSSPLESKHGRMTSGMTCHHRLWTAYTVKLRRAWHAIIAFGQHSRSNDVGRGMPSLPLGSTHGQTTSSVACHHSPWTANTIGQRQL